MATFLSGVMLMNFLVDILLLLAAGRLCGFGTRVLRIVAGGALGALYAACCLLPGFLFLGGIFWRIISLAAMTVVAYGCSRYVFRIGVVYSVLSLALGGAATGIGVGGVIGVVSAAVVLCVICGFGFRGGSGRTYVPVELSYGNKSLSLTALQDTGNTLRDPITGQQVLVIGADAAQKLTGLTQIQLRTPVESLGAIPGLRLIPYHSIGNKGFLLGMRLQKVRIGSWHGSTVVAFAPEGLSREGTYDALAGGTV